MDHFCRICMLYLLLNSTNCWTKSCYNCQKHIFTEFVSTQLACYPLASGLDCLAELVRALVHNYECSINPALKLSGFLVPGRGDNQALTCGPPKQPDYSVYLMWSTVLWLMLPSGHGFLFFGIPWPTNMSANLVIDRFPVCDNLTIKFDYAI